MENSKTLGPYSLLALIGEGPITAVYKAQHSVTGQTVALKRLPSDIGNHPALLKQIDRWAIRMRTPPHPGLPPLLALEQDGAHFYTVSPFLEGGTLRDEIGSLDTERINQVLLRLTDILMALHQFGQIHHNIKPENVLFDDQGKIFLTDVGLSAILRPRLDTYIGTPGYMSPEQIEGREVDGRSDFYTLGILLYEMLCGEAPFRADTPTQLCLKHVTEPIPTLHERFPHVPVIYDRLIDRLCQRSRDQRPADSHEAAELVVAAIAQIEGWPDTSEADYANDLPLFDQLTLYHKVPKSRETLDQEAARIRNIQQETERASQKRMEHFMAIEAERQARVQQELETQHAQERAVYIILIAFIVIGVLGVVGYYLTQLFG